jgi:hypothetical protein
MMILYSSEWTIYTITLCQHHTAHISNIAKAIWVNLVGSNPPASQSVWLPDEGIRRTDSFPDVSEKHFSYLCALMRQMISSQDKVEHAILMIRKY